MVKNMPVTTGFSGTERAPMRFMRLPEDLEQWAKQNESLIERIQRGLSDTYYTLNEEQLWEVVAAAFSPEWCDAKTNLQAAENRCKELNSPEKISLGLIGNALDSPENNQAKDAVTDSLARFALINEGLRERKDLGRLLDVLLVQKRMLEASAKSTQSAQKAEAALTGLTGSFARCTPKAGTPRLRPAPVPLSPKN